jgi:hypothetical protein
MHHVPPAIAQRPKLSRASQPVSSEDANELTGTRVVARLAVAAEFERHYEESACLGLQLTLTSSPGRPRR